MSSKQPKDDAPPQVSSTGEEQVADAITIIWMLAAVATLAAQLVAGLARAIVFFTGEHGTPLMVAKILPVWFLACSVVTGIVCLLLTPLAWYVRRSKPPLSIMVTAVAIGVLPLVVVIAIQVIHRT